VNSGKTVIAILIIALGAPMFGCTSNQPFRTNFTSTDPSCPTAVIEDDTDFKIGFVEFDDQGRFWDLRQRDAVKKMIEDEAGLPCPAGTKSQGIVIVTFVHGWKENAAYGGNGVTTFREILSLLNEAERSQTKYPPRKVVGVYMGWRGLSATWEPFKELSFWDRKGTAHKVGGYGAMTEMLVDLENLQKKSLASLEANAPRTDLIIIGHSFGGAAVYSALSQIITERFVNNVVENHTRLKPLGDQVILLNPAFEAQRHFDLNEMAQLVDRYPDDQRPVLSVFTSETDVDTHYWFPIGRFFATVFQANRDGEQRQAGLETVGWFKPFVTHELDYQDNASFTGTGVGAVDQAARKREYHDHDRLLKSSENIEKQRAKWHPNGTTPQVYTFDESVLKPISNFRPGNPFMVVAVDKRIMDGHDDIANQKLINFIREYIQFCQVDPKDHSK
jgi:hypothetical protein